MAAVSAAQQELAAALAKREQKLLDAEPVLAEPFDVTLPPVPAGPGGLQPSVQMMYDLNDAFATLNFTVYSGPEITSEQFDFDNLNFAPDHPAPDSMDTCWLSESAGKSGAERLGLHPHLTGASALERAAEGQRP